MDIIFKYKLDISVLAMLCIIIYLYLLHFIGFDFSMILGDLGDARLNNYLLEHGYQYLLGNHPFFWNAPFFYPALSVMTYSDNHIGTLPFYSLFRFIGNDIETSYQFWMVLIFLLNGVSSYMVLRLLRFNILGAFTGTLLFTISAPVMLMSGHIQLIPRFMVPIIFFAGLKYLETFRIKYFYIFIFAIVYQFYIGIYIGFFTITGFIALLPFTPSFIKKINNFKATHLIFNGVVAHDIK